MHYSLVDFRRQIQHFSSDRDEQVSKASKALETVGESRLRRATVSNYQNRVEDVLTGLAKLRKENDKSASFIAIAHSDIKASS
jgi:hypothetical protein